MVKKIFITITGILLGYYFYANKNNSTQTTRVECVNNPIIRNQKCRSILDIYKGDIIDKTFEVELEKNEPLKFIVDRLTTINQNASDSIYDFHKHLDIYKEFFLLSKRHVNDLHNEELKVYMNNYLLEVEKEHLKKIAVISSNINSIDNQYSKQVQDQLEILKILVSFNSISTNQVMPSQVILDNVISDYNSIINQSKAYLNIE